MVGSACLLATPAQADSRQILRGHVPAGISALRPIDRLAATQSLDLILALPLRNQQTLTNLVASLYQPTSPNYRHYLTPKQFAAQFGPTEGDYQAVIGFVKSNGLLVTATHPNRTMLEIRGSVSAIEKQFHVHLRVYQHPTEPRTFYAPDVEPSVDLAVPILGVRGLDNLVLPRPMSLHRRPMADTPGATPYATGAGPRGSFLGRDFRTAYAPDMALDGAGQVVGLFELDGYYASDIRSYEALAGLPNVALTNVLVSGVNGNPHDQNIEVALDLEMAIAMAPGLNKVIVYEGRVSSADALLNRMATDNLASQLSSSWGFGTTVDSVRDQVFLQFAAQGQSFFQASGDDGAWSSPVSPPSPPSDHPLLTVVGGTSLTTRVPDGAWASETTWPGSGGGSSTNFTLPPWQQGLDFSTNQGSRTLRNIPDVACLADDVIWIVANNGEQAAIGGTSAATPLWAGFAALVNQQAVANGQTNLGFLNPSLYAIGQSAAYPAVFHDIVTGNNTNSLSPTKFFAVPGYDLCTGWGTPAGEKLLEALLPGPDALGITPAAGFRATGLAGGPFSPASQTYWLTNSGSAPLNWALAIAAPWIEAAPIGGTLAAGDPALPVIVRVNTSTTNLSPGTYSTSLWLTNLNNGFAQVRSLCVNVVGTGTVPGVALSALYSFHDGADGGHPNALVFGADGLLYGTTRTGGTNGAGTVYQCSANGQQRVVYSFSGLSDGANPFAALVPGPDGNFYGSTFQGGAYDNGTLFRATTNGELFTMLSLNVTNGDLPYAALACGSDGKFYGTTYQGGANGHGSAFSLTINGGLTTLASFSDGSGEFPYAGLIAGGDGSLYGTTFKGGSSSNGTVFRLTSDGRLTTLFSFGRTNGAFPYAGLTSGADGSFYGVTSQGGTAGAGTLFRISSGGVFTNLYSFTGGSDGAHPAANLLAACDGNLYGTTTDGGDYGLGTLFRVAPDGALATLVECNGVSGANPQAALVAGPDGNLYGTTPYGGEAGAGTLFRLSITAAPQITMQPVSQTVFAGANVNLSVAAFGAPPLQYQWLGNGTNLNDGGNLSGTSTRSLSLTNVDPTDAGAYAVIVSNALGSVTSTVALLTVTSSPPYIAVQPTNQTVAPGVTVSLVAVALGNLPLFYHWQRDGTNLSDGGNLSGATTSTLTVEPATEAYNGTYALVATNSLSSITSSPAVLTVIPASAPGTRLTTLHSFGGGVDGFNPSGLVQANDGHLYGTVEFGGTNGLSFGAVFQVATNGAIANFASFSAATGAGPNGGLIQGADGNLYGTTTFGGTNATGNVFGLTLDGRLTNLYSFTAGWDGSGPTTSVIQGTDGNLYGTTDTGGTNSSGNVFKLTPAGVLENVYSFTRGVDGGPGINPLVQGTDGAFFGTCSSGGAHGYGTVFRLTPNGSLTPLFAFTGGQDGYLPVGALVQGSDGRFYGATEHSTFHGFQFYGTVFSISAAGGFATLYTFNGLVGDGFYPDAGVIQGGDGNLYGTTYAGGANGNGTVYRVNTNGASTALVSFDGFNDGAKPQASLTQGADGALYGTTTAGGAAARGTVFRLSLAPVITHQPTNQAAFLGSSVRFCVSVFGGPPWFFQWRRNGTNLLDGPNTLGSGSTCLALTNLAASDAGSYSVFVSNILGCVLSSNALLTVTSSPPIILVPPKPQTVAQGATANFSVVAVGNEPMGYQWRFDGTDLAGATGSALTLPLVQPANAGAYSVTVSNPLGVATSPLAGLRVRPVLAGAATNGVLVLAWSDTSTLQTATNVAGPYVGLPVTSPYLVSAAGPQRFFRLRAATAGFMSTPSFDGRFTFTVAGLPGYDYVVQGSTNLLQWIPLQTNPAPFVFADPATTNLPARFYRTVLAPN